MPAGPAPLQSASLASLSFTSCRSPCLSPCALQARAACTAGTASEVTSIAQLAQKEVAMLQGQLADLDRKNKMAVRHWAVCWLPASGLIPGHVSHTCVWLAQCSSRTMMVPGRHSMLVSGAASS